jgi:Ca2+-binding EF-hand superfamily protein
MILLALLLQVAPPPPVPGAPLIVTAPGQPPATMVVEPVAMAIAAFDADGDGKTTRAELDAGVRHSFEAIDTAHTGKLGYIAFADWAERWLGDRNALPSPFEIDTDGDNKITLAELEAQFVRVFTRLDRNKDGVVTRAEVLTIREMARGERPSDGKGRKGKK